MIDTLIILVAISMFIILIYRVNSHKKKLEDKLKKKIYYILEDDNPFFLNFIIMLIGIYLIMLLAFISDGDIINSNFIIFNIVILIFIMVLIIFYIELKKEKIKFKKEKDLIIKNGYKVTGEVVEDVFEESKGSNGGKTRRIYLIVKFNDNGEEIIYRTPQVLFSKYKLSSYDVDVYIYEDKYFVTNYKIKN